MEVKTRLRVNEKDEEVKSDDAVKVLHPLITIIREYSVANPGTPFLKHIEYFEDNKGGINASSIACKWSALSGEFRLKTMVRGALIIKSANDRAKCPYKLKFSSSKEVMPYLKHPCDTNIVNPDGSINLMELEIFMCKCFEYDTEEKIWFAKQANVNNYLKLCSERDNGGKWAKIAQEEWNHFFKLFADSSKEVKITAETLLEFYFDSTALYGRKVKNSKAT
ncbi:MAG: hypothetical protein Harvfovirus39_10 [Harvfovirus sp.]|uniref:Uncharacterized protein n=1 Tax=Harvfovirus sp. TaxID=2487768 RepID=A0A3G5A5K6_9VIRU|nr:MAG: hypothetical protein Harvfovirus39_10 [Harvfovirus sp.]